MKRGKGVQGTLHIHGAVAAQCFVYSVAAGCGCRDGSAAILSSCTSTVFGIFSRPFQPATAPHSGGRLFPASAFRLFNGRRSPRRHPTEAGVSALRSERSCRVPRVEYCRHGIIAILQPTEGNTGCDNCIAQNSVSQFNWGSSITNQGRVRPGAVPPTKGSSAAAGEPGELRECLTILPGAHAAAATWKTRRLPSEWRQVVRLLKARVVHHLTSLARSSVPPAAGSPSERQLLRLGSTRPVLRRLHTHVNTPSCSKGSTTKPEKMSCSSTRPHCEPTLRSGRESTPL